MQNLIRIADLLEVKKIMLTVFLNNEKGRQFYRKIGYVTDRISPTFDEKQMEDDEDSDQEDEENEEDEDEENEEDEDDDQKKKKDKKKEEEEYQEQEEDKNNDVDEEAPFYEILHYITQKSQQENNK
ncbi:MAG: hypothetical protein EZS28_015929 [Streblomastix strix]|uniref:Uncharacterized protein n=1 Tax=Streblomastix strix TaxID=222440 RepID=A0A5J4W171_9EUKA|nr:MAG: hypothetical protein EZS28_015929 [Streblomastix strix]